jgi:hypothetical protein
MTATTIMVEANNDGAALVSPAQSMLLGPVIGVFDQAVVCRGSLCKTMAEQRHEDELVLASILALHSRLRTLLSGAT